MSSIGKKARILTESDFDATDLRRMLEEIRSCEGVSAEERDVFAEELQSKEEQPSS